MEPLIITTRGSALALAQARQIEAAAQAIPPHRRATLLILKTTGDKLQAVAIDPANPVPATASTKGLFTKELEVALLAGEAQVAVHSLKDLPTDLPDGLILAATPKREDVRDVLILPASASRKGADIFEAIPQGATIATSSNRRAVQLQHHRPDVKTVPIRGNVGTRLKKLLTQKDPSLAGLILATAGLNRLGFKIDPKNAKLSGPDVPEGLAAFPIPVELMIPCVGQAAIGLEIRADDRTTAAICEKLNDAATFVCVTAERAFLRAMGGGCLSPVAAYATLEGDKQIRLRAAAVKGNRLEHFETVGSDPAGLGKEAAARLK